MYVQLTGQSNEGVIYVAQWIWEKGRQTMQDTALLNKRAQFAPAISSNYQDPSPA